MRCKYGYVKVFDLFGVDGAVDQQWGVWQGSSFKIIKYQQVITCFNGPTTVSQVPDQGAARFKFFLQKGWETEVFFHFFFFGIFAPFCSFWEEYLCCFFVAIAAGIIERGVSLGIFGIGVCAFIQEHGCNFAIPLQCRQVKRSLLAFLLFYIH